ncbi:PH (Pleckstrin Homology) domain-containing protein [Couchioplanes caeruleus]|uniref:PH (Pleckstrin Homology) domain-containing protein n=1 Tax=Couchioplanes caeruleus TaxID=56438 RepID=A0A3N1GQ85_9ACTN|nr:PH (Pleckstrin Homology) domain-containing protein [Couchioplanes caeruleus]
MSRKPVLRVRKSGAVFFAAVIAFVGTVSLLSAGWQLAPVLLIPLAVAVWAWRAGTDVDAEELRVRALIGSTKVSWSRVAELAPDRRGRVTALLTDGMTVPLTGVTTNNLAAVLKAGGQEVSNPPTPD